jgi:drug/metabolite transporter (DMT)-like permease
MDPVAKVVIPGVIAVVGLGFALWPEHRTFSARIVGLGVALLSVSFLVDRYSVEVDPGNVLRYAGGTLVALAVLSGMRPHGPALRR